VFLSTPIAATTLFQEVRIQSWQQCTLQIEEKGGRGMFAGNMVEGSSNFLTGALKNV
jgi:hypothetical protein